MNVVHAIKLYSYMLTDKRNTNIRVLCFPLAAHVYTYIFKYIGPPTSFCLINLGRQTVFICTSLILKLELRHYSYPFLGIRFLESVKRNVQSGKLSR